MRRAIDDMGGSLDASNFTEEIKIRLPDMAEAGLDKGELFYFPY